MTPNRTPKVHELKTDPEPFDAVWEGEKTFELRKNDRDFQVNDELFLRETVSTGKEMAEGAPLLFTGRSIIAEVSHILVGYGLQDGWCILSLGRSLECTDES